MTKLTIVGPLPKQQREIERQVRAKIKFVDPKHGTVLPDGPVVLWTRFLAHTAQDAVIKQAGRGRVVFHSTGLKQLITLLQGLAA